MDILIAPIYFLFAHQFLGLVGLGLVGIALYRLSNRTANLRLKAVLLKLAPLFFVMAFLNPFFGSQISTRLVHMLGKDARGVVTGSYSTSTQYNEHNVIGYHVLLALADGRTVEESFRDDTFNVYPPHNRTTYPGEGDHFDARYLPHFPSAFIILANGDGSFAANLRCDQLMRTLHSAEIKHQFAPTNTAYRMDAIAALQHYTDEHCELTPEARDDDAREMQQLKKEQP